MSDPADKTDAGPGSSALLAVERTRLAYDRTLMGATRTAISLITFGFAVYKFFQLDLRNGAPSNQLIGPREFGLMIISIGLISLLFATLEHRRDLLKLSALYPSIPRRTMARVVAALVTILGILALATAILRE